MRRLVAAFLFLGIRFEKGAIVYRQTRENQSGDKSPHSKLRFTKMHGCGNDYIYVDCFTEAVPDDIPGLARAMSDRHRGVGADGLILIGPSQVADARMRMWNADGSEAEMCGNGIRCVGKYLYDRRIVRRDRMRIETRAGILDVQVFASNGTVDQIRVNMGRPVLVGSEIPTTLPGDPPLNAALNVAGRELSVTCVSMGNPHSIVFVDEPTDEWVLSVGPRIERHPVFPRRTNVEFVQVVSPEEIKMRVWERGTGETLACGTGACAAAVAGALTARTGRDVLCHLPGGDLRVEWTESGEVFLTGPAVEVFCGEWKLVNGEW